MHKGQVGLLTFANVRSEGVVSGLCIRHIVAECSGDSYEVIFVQHTECAAAVGDRYKRITIYACSLAGYPALE